MFDLDVTSVAFTTTAVAFIIIILLRRYGEKKSDGRRAACLPALPLVGSLPFLKGGMDGLPRFFMKKAETLGPVIHFYAANQLAVVLNDKTSVVDALQRHSEAFGDRPDVWTESNVLNVDLRGIGFAHYDDAFKKRHKLILSILREFGYGQAKEAEVRICEEVEVLLREIREQNGRPINPKYTFAMVTGMIMVKILFGRKALTEKDSRILVEASNSFITSLEPKINNAPIIRFLPKYRKLLSVMVSDQEKLMKLLNEAIKHSRSDDSESNFVKRYLEIVGPNYDREDFIYILRDLNLGSADTVSTTLQWAMIDLANNPEVQRRVQKEIDEVIPDNRVPSLDDKPHLPYTEAVIMEFMRHHPLAPLAMPHMACKDTEVCGFHIPKGCLVLPNLYSVHMDPKVWIDPENFRPERFLDEKTGNKAKDMTLFFGIGKRSCIGEILGRHVVFLTFTALVQHFDIRPPEGRDKITVQEEFTITLRPTSYEIRMIPRKKATSQ